MQTPSVHFIAVYLTVTICFPVNWIEVWYWVILKLWIIITLDGNVSICSWHVSVFFFFSPSFEDKVRTAGLIEVSRSTKLTPALLCSALLSYAWHLLIILHCFYFVKIKPRPDSDQQTASSEVNALSSFLQMTAFPLRLYPNLVSHRHPDPSLHPLWLCVPLKWVWNVCCFCSSSDE